MASKAFWKYARSQQVEPASLCEACGVVSADLEALTKRHSVTEILNKLIAGKLTLKLASASMDDIVSVSPTYKDSDPTGTLLLIRFATWTDSVYALYACLKAVGSWKAVVAKAQALEETTDDGLIF